jgi:hypothetical protein
MEPPRSRYRVEEKDGRLVVIDTSTGERASSPAAPPPASLGAPRAGAGPIAPGKGLGDAAADFLVKRATKGTDADGRAVLAWEWEVNGRRQRWATALDDGQQRRLGRALLAFVKAAIVAAFLIIVGLPLFAIIFAVPFLVRGWWGLSRLRSETSR